MGFSRIPRVACSFLRTGLVGIALSDACLTIRTMDDSSLKGQKSADLFDWCGDVLTFIGRSYDQDKEKNCIMRLISIWRAMH